MTAFNESWRIVGFNLLFDLAGISDVFSRPSKKQRAKWIAAGADGAAVGEAASRDTGWGTGVDGDEYDNPEEHETFCKARDRGRLFRNGFSLIMCGCHFNVGKGPTYRCPYHPRIRIKKLGVRKYAIQWGSVRTRATEKERAKDGNEWKTKRSWGEFIDVGTVGLALRKPKGKSLKKMCEGYRNNMSWLPEGYKFKDCNDIEHGRPITPQYLDYAMAEVKGLLAVQFSLPHPV